MFGTAFRAPFDVVTSYLNAYAATDNLPPSMPDTLDKSDTSELVIEKTESPKELPKPLPTPSRSSSTSSTSSTESVSSLIPRRRDSVEFLSIATLVETINNSYDAKSSNVTTIILREDKQGYKHQFLLLQTKTPENTDLWIRLDRAAGEKRAGIFSRSSTFLPSDTAMLAGNEAKLIEGPESDVNATIRFIGPQMVSLFTLQILLSSFLQEAKTYVAATQNCWFFCSVLLSILSTKYPHTVEGTLSKWTAGLLTSHSSIETLFLRKIQEFVDNSEDPKAVQTSPDPSLTTKRPPVPPTPQSTSILFYAKDQPFFEFSNFSPSHIKHKGKTYPTAEHLFHSFKFVDQPGLAEHFATFSIDPRDVLPEVKKNQRFIRHNSIEEQMKTMDKVLNLKFSQNDELLQKLLQTEDTPLLYSAPDDPLWGTGSDGRGRNELGKVLMKVRERLA